MRHLVFLGVLVFGLSACTEHLERVPADWQPSAVRLHCASGDCPAGTGLVLFVTKRNFGFELFRCSGTLISGETLLTNAHCDQTGKPGVRGYFILPSVAGAPQFAEISGRDFNVKGKQSGLDRDLAILRLKTKLDTAPRKISRTIPAKMDSLVTYVVNRGAGRAGYDFNLEKRTCRTLKSMPLYGGGTEQNHVGLALLDCELRKGNSGAAAFLPDDLDEIQAVLNTVWKFTPDNDDYRQVRGLFFDLPAYFNTGYAMAERVQCQPIAGQSAPDLLCPAVDFERTVGDPFRAAVAKEVEKRLAGMDPTGDLIWTTEIFSVKMDGSAPAVILAPKPFCVQSTKGRAQNLKVSYLKLGLMPDGSARTAALSEDPLQVTVTGTDGGNILVKYDRKSMHEGAGAIHFKPGDRIKYVQLASPSSIQRIPQCDADSFNEAKALSLKNIHAITVQDPARAQNPPALPSPRES